MITLTNLTGLASIIILIATTAMLLFRALRIPLRYAALLTCIVVIITCLPLGGLPPAAYVRGVTGDLSITLVVLLALKLLALCTETSLFKKGEKVLLWALIALGALALYPFALEMGYVDPYRWGFGNMWLLAVLFGITLLAFCKRFYVIASCIALAVLAWSVGWNEATNLWNYVLDPFVAIYAIGALVGGGVSSLLQWRRRTVS